MKIYFFLINFIIYSSCTNNCNYLVELSFIDKVENAKNGKYYDYRHIPITDVNNNIINFKEITVKYPRDSFAFSEFADCNNVVKKLKIKKIDKDDIKLRVYLDSLYSNNIELQIKRIKFIEKDTMLQKQMIDIAICNTIIVNPNVNCCNVGGLIEKYYENDQNNRTNLDCHIDKECLTQMISIIERCGFNVIENLGKEYVTKCFIIFQHANYKIRKKYYNYFELASQKKLLNLSDLALMIDRNLENETGIQRYGTQFNITSKGNFLIPLENYLIVDSLRKTVDLQPLSEYMDMNNIKFQNDNFLK